MNEDQRAKWKAAIAAKNRRQRQRRGKRHTVPCGTVNGPGMMRVTPQRERED